MIILVKIYISFYKIKLLGDITSDKGTISHKNWISQLENSIYIKKNQRENFEQEIILQGKMRERGGANLKVLEEIIISWELTSSD